MSAIPALYDLLGNTLVGIRRVLYVHKGVVDKSAGPLEVTFDGSVSVTLDAGGDGESLAVKRGPWVDAFREPLSQENRLFAEASGKWTAFDTDVCQPLGRAVGHKLDQVDIVRVPSGKVVGVKLRFGNVVIHATVEFDELIVDVA